MDSQTLLNIMRPQQRGWIAIVEQSKPNDWTWV